MNRPRSWSLALAVLFGAAVLLAAGCARDAGPTRPVVLVTVAPQAWFVERLAGDLVDVEVMLPPGANEATYEPTLQQMRAVSDASIYLKVGHPAFAFERAWLDRLIGDRPDLVVLDGSGGISCPGNDPHVWLSPGVARITARALSSALADLLPDSRQTISENLEALLAEVDAIDAHNRELLAPHQGGRFLVFHAAWSCFARQYGLVQVSIEEGAKEPGPKALAELIDQVREDGVHVIFVQPQFPQRAAEEIARAIDAEVVVLDPLARDWPATMRGAAEAISRSFER